MIETWNIIKKYVPVNQFKKLGYLVGLLEDDINIIKEIYRVSTIDSLVNTVAEHRSYSFYRKSKKLQINQTNMLAWSKIAEYEAKKLEVDSFNDSQMDQLKSNLHTVFFENIEVKTRTKKLLADHGI